MSHQDRRMAWRAGPAASSPQDRAPSVAVPAGRATRTSGLQRKQLPGSADSQGAASPTPAAPSSSSSSSASPAADPFDYSAGALGHGAAAPVQRQRAPAASHAAAGTAQPAAQGAATNAAAGPPLFPQVRAAVAARDLPAVLALQRQLRQRLDPNPTSPTDDTRDGLAYARKWMMERIAAIRATYDGRLTTARSGASAGRDNTSATEALEIAMDGECTPYLEGLLAGDPQHRYEHPNPAVSEAVLAAVRLHSSRRAVGQLEHDPAAETEARRVGGLSTGPWCGAFAYTQAERAGGFDHRQAGAMQGESGIRHALHYSSEHGAQQTWVWTGSTWERLKEYHQRRGAMRSYEEIDTGPPAGGIHPGDLILIDNNFGEDPDHITTAISFDGRFLTVVGGNERTTGDTVRRSDGAIDLTRNPPRNDVRRRNAQGEPIPRTVDPRRGPKHVRVHGVGRWSVVDYERHIYVRAAQQPTAPPDARLLRQLR